jgi:hypothetical protein
MTVKLCPLFNGQTMFTPAGNVLSGGLIQTYLAGTTSPAATYTDSTGLTANLNPIVLTSAGTLPAQIWMPTGEALKFVLQTAAGVTLQTEDNISGINDTTSSPTSEWLAQSAPTFISGTSFSVAGNQTSTFQVGRRVQAQINSGFIYATIKTSAFTTLTTVTLTNDSGALDNTLSAVAVGLLGETNPSVPAIIPYDAVGFHAHLGANQTSGTIIVFDTVDSQAGGTNYSNSTGLFTAPFTGWYAFSTSINVTNSGSAATVGVFLITTSSQNSLGADASVPTVTSTACSCSVVCLMTAGDTCKVVTTFTNTATLFTGAANTTQFSGFMLRRTA